MKKIKKILPVLLGVMVLMFGTLTVSAAENDSERVYWESVLDSSFGRQLKSYIQESYSDYKYIAVRTENNHKYGVVYLSDCPFYEFKKVDETYYSISCYNRDNVNCRYVTLNYSTPDFEKWSFSPDTGSSKMTQINISLMGGNHLSDRVLSNYELVKYGSEDAYISTSTGYTSFFPQPPVAQAATALPPVVRNQTKIILITAVACLALLAISLVLLKKLPRFLNR